MGDDEQESEVAEWEQYIADPPEGELVVAEDNDDDAEQAVDWAEGHPRQVAEPDKDDRPAEESAIHEIPGR